ncbi:MAG TPA: Tn3 family transposase [Streptosporangiaceae bacterium]|nr:Tn3 family transposase [Streptosporangiaceae bacterium]
MIRRTAATWPCPFGASALRPRGRPSLPGAPGFGLWRLDSPPPAAGPDHAVEQGAQLAGVREVGGRLSVNTEVSIDADGKIHLTGVKAIEEPPSLVDLRSRTSAMLPRVDLPEVILEVMSWAPELAASFTAVSGGRSRLDDLPISVAACLAAHAMNIGYTPVAKKGVPALERARLSRAARDPGRGERPARRPPGRPAPCAGVGRRPGRRGRRDAVRRPGPRRVARPNQKYFGSKRGMTWLNAINDHGMGRGAKIVSGTVRDSLHMVDVIFGLDGGELPEIVVSDTGSYSDVVFGLLELLGISYRPALADLPDQKGWRIKADADYGPLSTFARGRIDTAKIRRNWEDILRVVASIYTGTVRAYDVVTMLQRDGHPTALGEAIAMYGRIFKTLHILSYIDTDETYRRDIKGIRNLQEGRRALARKICHGRKGELYHRYERGLENQLGALGLVLNCVVLWTTVYLDAAVRHLKAQGYLVLDEDMARLSPFVSRHLGMSTAPTASSSPTWPPVPSANCAIPTPATMTTSEGGARSLSPVAVPLWADPRIETDQGVEVLFLGECRKSPAATGDSLTTLARVSGVGPHHRRQARLCKSLPRKVLLLISAGGR